MMRDPQNNTVKLEYKSPPLIVKPEMAKVIKAELRPGGVIEMKMDNRYKDGNIRIINGVVRGNKETISLIPLTLKR